MQSNKWVYWRKRLLLPGILSLGIIGALCWGIYQDTRRRAYEHELQAMYTRSFYELVDSANTMQLTLSKLLVSNSPGISVELLNGLSRSSDTAVSSLSQLPTSHTDSNSTMSFLNLAGDYGRYLSLHAAGGHPIGEDEVNNLRMLHNSCVELNTQLFAMLEQGQVQFAALERNFYSQHTDELASLFFARENSGASYPTLIYDGPFSEGLTRLEARGLPQGEIGDEQALQKAASVLGLSGTGGLQVVGAGTGDIGTLIVSAARDGREDIRMQITRQGGCLMMLMEESDRARQAKLTLAQCSDIASQWLAEQGFDPLGVTWTQQYDGYCILNYAAIQQSVVLYPDLVKVKVRMDDGGISAVDATGYWLNHVQRQLPEPAVPQDQARYLVSPTISITREQLCVIPTNGGGELLAWEFMGTSNEDTFIVYIDALTGEEVNVFKVIGTSEGSLVV